MLVAFALTRVARWSSDDNDGRLEMQLSAPVPRWWVVVERAIASLAGTFVVIAIGAAVFHVAASARSIGLHAGDLIVASLALLPFVLSFAALGAVLTSRVSRMAIVVLATFAFLS